MTSCAKCESSSLFTVTSPAYAIDFRLAWDSRDTADVAPRRATVRGMSFIGFCYFDWIMFLFIKAVQNCDLNIESSANLAVYFKQFCLNGKIC